MISDHRNCKDCRNWSNQVTDIQQEEMVKVYHDLSEYNTYTMDTWWMPIVCTDTMLLILLFCTVMNIYFTLLTNSWTGAARGLCKNNYWLLLCVPQNIKFNLNLSCA